MRVLFTGATGVLGRAAVPLLVADDHDVKAVARSDEDHQWLDGIGARPVSVDLFDKTSIDNAMDGVDAVVHYATAIPPQSQFPKREAWATNDRLRAIATGLLVDAAIANDVGRFIQQSITYAYASGGESWLDESSPIVPAWEVYESAPIAESHVDRFRESGGVGVTLRLSRLYGPGQASSEFIDGVRARKIPIVGKGDNYVSSVHLEDAATALVAALTAPDGTYNVTDNSPLTQNEDIHALTAALGVRPPRRVPVWVGRLALRKAVTLLINSHRVSNQAFKQATGWSPRYPSVVEGWPEIIT